MNPADSADVELDALIELFYPDSGELGEFVEVTPDDIPSPSRDILAHNHHMTVAVEYHHQSPVDVKVFQTRMDGNHYSRKITLTRERDGGTVMFGIVRLDLEVLSPEVRHEIESQKTPLGRILINHSVMRSVKWLSLFRIVPGNDLRKLLGIENENQACFGRTALIYCDGEPAIELLEIVTQ